MERRQYYRINYPVGDRPRLTIFGNSYSIANLSEGGALVAEVADNLAIGTEVRGVITFANNRKCEVEGKVIRIDAENRVVFQLTEKVPLPIIMDEQRRLIQRYNTLKTDGKNSDET